MTSDFNLVPRALPLKVGGTGKGTGSISRANGDRRSQIEKHVVVYAKSAGRQLWQYFRKQYTPTIQLPGNLIECVNYADEDMYPNIRVLLIIGCTLPVSSAEAELSFSGLRRIKLYLRNRMSDERLSGLALMHLHHDLDIDVDEICTIFVTKYKRRMFQECILYE